MEKVEETKKENNKSRKVMIIIIAAIMVLLSAAGTTAVILFQKKNEQPTTTVSADEYIYKARYYFGTEAYIYLMGDKTIKYVEYFQKYETKPDCNCLEPTGEVEEKETIVGFSDKSRDVVISVLDRLSERAGGAKEFDTDELNLTNAENRVLLAVATKNEDRLTVADNTIYEEKARIEEIPIEGSRFQFANTLTVLKSNTSNKAVNKAANYINDLAEKAFDKYNNEAKVNAKDSYIIANVNEILGVAVKSEIVYAGPFSISATVTVSGNLGYGAFTTVRGYVINYSGEVVQEIAGGLRVEYADAAIAALEKTEYYESIKTAAYPNWRENFRGEILQFGHWYLTDDGLTFLFAPSVFGATGPIENTLNIVIEAEQF